MVAVDRIMPLPQETSVSQFPESINMSTCTARGSWQVWLRILRWQDELGLSTYILRNHRSPSQKEDRRVRSGEDKVTREAKSVKETGWHAAILEDGGGP